MLSSAPKKSSKVKTGNCSANCIIVLLLFLSFLIIYKYCKLSETLCQALKLPHQKNYLITEHEQPSLDRDEQSLFRTD